MHGRIFRRNWIIQKINPNKRALIAEFQVPKGTYPIAVDNQNILLMGKVSKAFVQLLAYSMAPPPPLCMTGTT